MNFIAANFWILLAMCGVVFVLGIVLWLIGTAMTREGERRLQAIANRPRIFSLRSEGPIDCIYPPIPDDAYDPIEF